MGTRRDTYVEKLKARLDDWNERVDNLEAAARRLGTGVSSKVNEELQIVKARRDELSTSIEKVRNASGSAWKDLRRGVKSSRKALDKAFRSAATHFKQQPPEKA